MMEEVVLVDEFDRVTGRMEKILAHETGNLHRAFSIFLFNRQGQLLLQQRALSKYHSPGLWTNTCCGHPRPGETTRGSARRRLMEEMGIEAPMMHAFSFRYRSAFENGLTEHEVDHVFVGIFDRIPKPDPAEILSWKFVPAGSVQQEISENPDNFTTWFRLVWPVVDHWLIS